MKGDVPETSKNTHTYVTSCLLTFHFLGILQALDEETELDTLNQQVFQKKISVLKYNVHFLLYSFTHYDSRLIRISLIG